MVCVHDAEVVWLV